MIYRNLLILFFFFLAVFSAIFLYRFHFYPDFGNGYITCDWLIHYEDGGFKRRGLSGSFAFLIQDYTGIQLQWIVYIMQMILFISFFIVFLKLVWMKEISPYYFTLVLSPLAFLSYFNDIGYLGRKEFILFLLFAVFIYLIDRKKLSFLNETLILISISIAILFHEIIFFYIPYFLIALYLSSPKQSLQRYFMYAAFALIPILLITFFGGEINQGRSIENLTVRGVKVHTSNIFMSSMGLNIQDEIKEKTHYWLYLLSFMLGVLHYGYFILKKLNHIKKNFLLAVVTFVFTLPLFYLAIDWGRWLQIHFMLSLLLITLLLNNRNDSKEYDIPFWKRLANDSVVLLLLPFLFLWGIKHYYDGFVPGGIFFSFYHLLT